MGCMRSKNHELYMDVIVKRGLCSFDDKRYWKNLFESYAFGHYQRTVIFVYYTFVFV